nr:uncharacterized protein LOC127316180 [Lolium perenne]
MTPTPSNFHGSLRPKQLQIDALKMEEDTRVPPSTDHGGSRDFPGANPAKKPQRHLGDAFKKGAVPEAAAIAGLGQLPAGQQPRQGISPGLVASSYFVPKIGPPSSTLPTNTSPLPGAAAPGTPPAPTTAQLQHHHGQGLPRQPAATPRPPTPGADPQARIHHGRTLGAAAPHGLAPPPSRRPAAGSNAARPPRRPPPRPPATHRIGPAEPPPAATHRAAARRPPPRPPAPPAGHALRLSYTPTHALTHSSCRYFAVAAASDRMGDDGRTVINW